MSGAPAIPFVDLKRTFREWRRDRNNAGEAVIDEEKTTTSRTLTWPALLERKRAVILAEPGSGKTRELRETVDRLRREGASAFFVRLDRLVTAGLPEVLGPALAVEFERCRRGENDAYYFLDSVDEAKLTRTSDFYSALGKFSEALGPVGRSRSRIYLSSRVSEWREDQDYDDVTALLCEPLQKNMIVTATGENQLAPSDHLLVVKLSPLDRGQVEAFALQIVSHEPEQFISGIDQAFAWEFAQRPLDVIDLARFWNESHRLGTLTELVEAHVLRNLRETPERAREHGSAVTEDAALVGARTLAAATLLCQKSAFAVLAGVDGLDAAECLPANWPSAQTNALLGRALFDDASFGKRQFHHRRAAEFLAAKWIAERMAHGCARRTLREIFFEATPTGLNLRPGLDATAAWLCGASEEWAEDFRAWVLASRPEIHLSFGDPAALSMAYRREVLRHIAARYADRSRAWIEADPNTLMRFASPDLADEISRLFLDATTVAQLRWHLLHMAAQRKLAGCVDAALLLVAIEGADEQLRSEAAEIVIGVGGPADRQRLAAAARAGAVFGEGLGMALIRALYPATLSTAEFVELASKVRETALPIFPTVLARHFEENPPAAEAGELLRAFLGLLQRAPYVPAERNALLVSQQFIHLHPVLVPICRSVLGQSTLTPDEINDLVVAFLVVGDRAHEIEQEKRDAFAAATERHPAMRRTYFLRCVEIAAAERGEEPGHFLFFPFGHEALLRVDRRDLDWLVAEIVAVAEPNRRLTLFRIALNIWFRSGRDRGDKQRILAAVCDAPALLDEFRRTIAGARRAPFRWWWEANIRYRVGQSFWWKRHWREFRDRLQRWRLFIHLNLHLWKIASGTDAALLCYLARQADKEGHSSWTATAWKNLSRRFGPLVRWATRRGCKRMWRQHNPGPPSAKPDRNRTSPETIAGLNGIQAEWADGELGLGTLPDSDARTATFYAVNELNSPPPWFDELAAAHPAAVGGALMTCIEHEWTMRLDEIRVYGVLAKVLGRAGTLGILVESGVLGLMAQCDPTQPQILDFALRLVTPRRSPGFAAVARARTLAAAAGSSEATLWAASWLRADAAAALTWLQGLPAPDANTDRLLVGICSTLHGGELFRPARDPDASYLRAPLLADFIRLAYRHVRVVEDQVHHGSYSPNGRVHAQEFRNSLVNFLADQSGEDVTALLSAVADDPFLGTMRDYVLDRRDAQIRARTRPAAWRATAIREFSATDEADPRTDRDLNLITLKRLDDIKYAVELSDNSLRAALRATDNEAALRHFVATELLRRANGRYRPPQEGEIDEARRPDIRIEHPAVAGPVSIEIKWAENWTLAELLERLENQLVATYMRPHQSHYGVFLLGMIARRGKTGWASPAGGTDLTFQQVVAIVRARAAELLASTPGIEGVEVIAIDFRPPSAWER